MYVKHVIKTMMMAETRKESAAPKISKKHNKKFIAEKEESNLCRVNDQWI